MPTYDYHCEQKNRTLEARHGMQEQLHTWGELCERTGESLGDTPANASIKKLATGGQVVSSGSLGEKNIPPCASGGCPGGACGFNS